MLIHISNLHNLFKFFHEKCHDSYRHNLKRCQLNENYFPCITGLLEIGTQTLLLILFFF